MPDDEKNPSIEQLVKRLVAQTGITEAQATELIILLGVSWPSLVREAKALKSRR